MGIIGFIIIVESLKSVADVETPINSTVDCRPVPVS